MSNGTSTLLARQIGALYSGGSAVGLSDRQLLERFAEARDEAAFAALVARHGPTVLGICRRHLGDHQHAEDAFQAVFLVLARKAGSLREPELLGNWLYGVALRTARTARARLARRRRVEEEAAGAESGSGSGSSSGPGSFGAVDRSFLDGEQAEALHREIDRLPGPFRLPVVLCYFEGLTLDEAARRLSWPVGTLRSRLARPREKLRRGLVRRGFAPTAGVLGGSISHRPFPFPFAFPRPLSSSASSLLCDSTTRAAIAFAARRGAGTGEAVAPALAGPAAATAQEVLRTMLIHKLRAAALSLLFLAVGAAGAGWLARPHVMGDEPRMKGQSSSKGPRVDFKAPADVSPARLLVDGRVIDPQGRPVAQARVAVLADRRARAGDRDGRHRNILVGTAAVDANGRFSLDVDGLPGERLERLTLLASAPGRALTAAALKPGDVLHEATVTLEPERPVEGRLVDIQGQPASGVVVRVAKIDGNPPLVRYDGKGQPILWPSAATTGADGRFRILGLGAGAGAAATFEVEDTRHAHQSFTVSGGGSGSSSGSGSTITLRPAQAVEVRVVHADDGKPAAGALVAVQALRDAMPTNDIAYARTDDQGRARVVGWPASAYRVRIDPAEGEPYFHVWDDLDWPTAAVRITHEFRLRRGTVVSGRVVENSEGTSKPIAGAWMTYYQTARDNPRRVDLLSVEAVSGPDGSFRLVVPAGPGHLLIEGPGEEYLHVETSSTAMGIGLRPSFHLYPHAHTVLDIPPGEARHPVEIRLRRGVTITGRVIGPDGRAVAEGWVFGRGYAPYREGAFPFGAFNGPPPRVEVKDGRFAIPGCDPENPGTFHFIDAKDRLGATVELSGKSAADGPVTVKLQPTATARFAIKDADGRPIAGRDADWPTDLRLVITPGPDFGELKSNFDAIPGDFTYQEDIDPASDRNLKSGPDGRVTMINLIPGGRYRFHGREFTPRPGETVNLGDVPAPKPEG